MRTKTPTKIQTKTSEAGPTLRGLIEEYQQCVVALSDAQDRLAEFREARATAKPDLFRPGAPSQS